MRTRLAGIAAVGLLALAAAGCRTSRELTVAAAPTAVQPLRVGDRVPSVALTTFAGQAEPLADLLGGKPTILIFYRGGWCPFCTRHLAALQQVYPQLQEAGWQMLAVSPDSPAHHEKFLASNKLGYKLFTDPGLQAISAFGLAFALDEATLTKYRQYKLPLAPIPGRDDIVLPVPAVYLVDAGQTIRYVHYDPDYKQRLDPQDLLKTAKATLAQR